MHFMVFEPFKWPETLWLAPRAIKLEAGVADNVALKYYTYLKNNNSNLKTKLISKRYRLVNRKQNNENRKTFAWDSYININFNYVLLKNRPKQFLPTKLKLKLNTILTIIIKYILVQCFNFILKYFLSCIFNCALFCFNKKHF